MTSAASRPQGLAPPEEFARDLIALQHPKKKTIDPYSYYYNQMTKNRNRQDLLNRYQGYNAYPKYNPNRMQLLHAQRYMPYKNMVMRTKSYSRKNPLAEKISKLSQRLRGPVGMARKSKECDCEDKKQADSYKVQTLSGKLRKKTRPEQVQAEQQENQVAPENTDPLEQALLEQEQVSSPRRQTEQDVFKPGVCPNKFTFGRCLIDCYQDSDCQGNQICVSRYSTSLAL